MASEAQGRYFLEDATGRVGCLAIEPLGANRFTFVLHTAVPGRCGRDLSGEAEWVDGQAVFSEQGGEAVHFINRHHAIMISASGPESAGAGPCSLTGLFTNLDTPPPGTIEEIVRDIRTHYAAVNSQLNRLETVEADLEGQSSEGGRLKAWFDEDEIRKLDVIHYGEMGKLRTEFYYWLGRLLFVFQAEDRYREPFGEIASTLENRYYFSQDRLVRWVGPEKTELPLTSEAADEIEKSLNDQSSRYSATARGKRP